MSKEGSACEDASRVRSPSSQWGSRSRSRATRGTRRGASSPRRPWRWRQDLRRRADDGSQESRVGQGWTTGRRQVERDVRPKVIQTSRNTGCKVGSQGRPGRDNGSPGTGTRSARWRRHRVERDQFLVQECSVRYFTVCLREIGALRHGAVLVAGPSGGREPGGRARAGTDTIAGNHIAPGRTAAWATGSRSKAPPMPPDWPPSHCTRQWLVSPRFLVRLVTHVPGRNRPPRLGSSGKRPPARPRGAVFVNQDLALRFSRAGGALTGFGYLGLLATVRERNHASTVTPPGTCSGT